jgi:hypothetical protein
VKIETAAELKADDKKPLEGEEKKKPPSKSNGPTSH